MELDNGYSFGNFNASGVARLVVHGYDREPFLKMFNRCPLCSSKEFNIDKTQTPVYRLFCAKCNQMLGWRQML